MPTLGYKITLSFENAAPVGKSIRTTSSANHEAVDARVHKLT